MKLGELIVVGILIMCLCWFVSFVVERTCCSYCWRIGDTSLTIYKDDETIKRNWCIKHWLKKGYDEKLKEQAEFEHRTRIWDYK